MIPVVPADSLLVHYENLHKEVRIAEAQKDVLVQALRAAFPRIATIVEERADAPVDTGGKASLPLHISVNCESCDTVNSWTPLDTASVRTHRFRTHNFFDLTFQTTQQNNFIWKVAVRPGTQVFHIVAATGLQKNQPLSTNQLRIEACEDFTCRKKNGYASLDEAQTAVEGLVGKAVAKTHHSGQIVETSILTTPILVNAREYVSVLYRVSPTLTIRTHGQALTSGRLGDLIKVRIEDSLPRSGMMARQKSQVNGRIVGPAEVTYAE